MHGLDPDDGARPQGVGGTFGGSPQVLGTGGHRGGGGDLLDRPAAFGLKLAEEVFGLILGHAAGIQQ